MIFAILSGILLALSMPGPDLGALAWIALIPLFWALRGKEPKEAFRLSFIAGAVFFGLLLYWLFTLWEWTSAAIIPGFAILIAYLGLYWGVFGWAYSWLDKRLPGWALAVAAPALWVILEFVRSLTRFGFPWGQAADGIYQQLEFVQLASITGIWGVSFLVVIFNYLLFKSLAARKWRYAACAAIILGATLIWGVTEMARPLEAGAERSLALLQPSIPQRERNDPTRLEEFLGIYQLLLNKLETQSPAEAKKPDLVVLPESALPTFILDDNATLEFFTNWAINNQTHLLTGTFTFKEPNHVFNSAIYFSTYGPSSEIYRKVQLVPFSTEYFPGIQFFNDMGLSSILPVGRRLGLLTPGTEFRPISTELGKIATPICFESIFPQISREFVKNGAELILVITNDAWFKRTWALNQHFAKGVYRAVENRRFFVQAANSGISGFIDPFGKIQERSLVEDRSVTTGRVSFVEAETLFTRFGDWFVYLLGAALALLFIISLRQGGRFQSPAS